MGGVDFFEDAPWERGSFGAGARNGAADLRGYAFPPQGLIGLMTVGTSNPNVPLVIVGAPDCYAYTDLVINVVVPVASATLPLAIPASPSVIGASLFAQSAALAPTLDALGIVSGNGMHGVVGDV